MREIAVMADHAACGNQQPPPAPVAPTVAQAPDAGMPSSAAADGGSSGVAGMDAGLGVADQAKAAAEAAKASIEGLMLPAAPDLPKTPAFLGDAQEPPDNPTTKEKAAL